MAYGAIQRKDWASAAEALQQLTTLAPGSARAWIELSYVESFRGHYRAASNAITSAARIPRPPSADLADILARLRTFNDATTVREIARKLLHEPRRDAGLLSACAMHLSNLNDHALALECARMAVAADQGGIAPRLVRGQMFAQHGDLEHATSDFEWCLARAPGLASAWWALSRLRRQTTDSNHVPSVRRLLARTGLSPADVAYASFALHKSLDDLGDVEGAWTALEQA
jgi:tetratricopeptide (TPR) repeat protein